MGQDQRYTQVTKSFGESSNVIPPAGPHHRGWRVHGLRRPLGLRQVHPSAPDRGLEDMTSGTIEPSTARTPPTSPPAKRGLAMVFQSYALYPHMSVRKNIAFPMRDGEGSRKMNRSADRGRGQGAEPDRLPRPPPRAAVGRPAPAGGHRAGHRSRTGGLPLRRAAVEPRRGAAGRACGWKSPRLHKRLEDDDDLCHPRPGRGDDDGRQDRGPARRQYRTGRQPAGALPRAAQHLRRGLHRLAQDEPDRRQAGGAEGTAMPTPSASGPSIST